MDAPSEESSASQATRILIAEDHLDSRDALQALLEAQGYEVIVARDGQEAIVNALSERPHVILMDVMMPIIDGLAATRHLRGLPDFQEVPIIALTAMEGARDRALDAGCDDYVTKPIDLRAFYQKVRWWLEHGRGGGESGEARFTGAPG